MGWFPLKISPCGLALSQQILSPGGTPPVPQWEEQVVFKWSVPCVDSTWVMPTRSAHALRMANFLRAHVACGVEGLFSSYFPFLRRLSRRESLGWRFSTWVNTWSSTELVKRITVCEWKGRCSSRGIEWPIKIRCSIVDTISKRHFMSHGDQLSLSSRHISLFHQDFSKHLPTPASPTHTHPRCQRIQVTFQYLNSSDFS